MKQKNILGIILSVAVLATSNGVLRVGATSLEEGYAKAQLAEISPSNLRAKNMLFAQGGGGPRIPQASTQDANVRGQINQLYRLILNRTPDDFGMNYYLSRYYNDRWSMEQIRQELFNSDEARRVREQAISQANNGRYSDRRDDRYNNRYENQNNNQYDRRYESRNQNEIRYVINQSYRRILNRNADDFGMNYYLERYYNDGWSIARIQDDLWNSDEGRNLRDR